VVTATQSAVLGVYAANIHDGGAVVGAASLVRDLIHLARHEDPGLSSVRRLEILVSTQVARALTEEASLRPARVNLRIRDDSPTAGLLMSAPFPVTEADCVLVFRGPAYCRFRTAKLIMGFADNSTLAPVSGDGLRAWLKRRTKIATLRRGDAFTVQTSDMRERLSDRLGRPERTISVIPNALPASPSPTPLPALAATEEVPIAFPARGYPHKNHAVLSDVVSILATIGWKVRIHVTLSETEWAALSGPVRAVCRNWGVLPPDRMGEIYASTHLTLFPSLNETFSLTPLESMGFGRAVVASDRSFVRDTVGQVPVYVEPTDPRSIAQGLASLLSDPDRLQSKIAEGLEYIHGLPTHWDRARAHLAQMLDLSIPPGDLQEGYCA